MEAANNDWEAIKKQEALYGVEMTEEETAFLEDQRTERKMFCDAAVDRKWAKMMQRKERTEAGMAKLWEREKKEMVASEKQSPAEGDGAETESDEPNTQASAESDAASIEYEADEPKAKKRRVFGVRGADADLPQHWQHIRTSERKVRPEYYRVVDKLMSSFHMSLSQATAAVVEVGRSMFNLKWKYHDDDEQVIDVDTAPHKKNNITMSKAIEAFTLSKIVQEMLDSEDRATITYHDDGSRTQGTGAYSVQGITAKGQYYALPTLKIAAETRENLADLKVAVLSLLAVCGGVTKESLWEKVDFVMTDSVSHNMGVADIVSQKLEVSHIPDHLLCHVHPSLMFNREICKLWSDVDSSIGPHKVFAGFSVTIGNPQVSVTENWLDCLLRLVSHDFDHKQWNKAEMFDMHIGHKKNPAKTLQKERFNSLVYSCAVALYLDQDVTDFLLKFQTITNQLACIVRCFEQLDYVRVLAAVGVAVGVHLVEPFVSLTSSSSTTYADIREAFPQLYVDLTTTPVENLLTLSRPAFSFISEERFQQVLYPKDLLKPAEAVLDSHKQDACRVLKMLLARIATGWLRQRGDVFQFGPDADPMAPSRLDKMDKGKLAGAPINNLDPERSVGTVNYGLKMRGSEKLEAVSRAHVKARGAALIDGVQMDASYKKLVKKDGELPQILEAWSRKQRELKEEGLGEKEATNISVDRQRNADLASLRALGGPFTDVEEVEAYMAHDISDSEKNSRLYLEIRHARSCCLIYPKAASIFRLKRNFRNLTTEEYARNLCVYLAKITCRADVNISDFSEALNRMV